MNFDHIEHYGVPGMRWGVRNHGKVKVNKSNRHEYQKRKQEVKADRKAVMDAIKGGNQIQGNKLINQNLEKAKKDPLYGKAYMNRQTKEIAGTAALVVGGAFVAKRLLNNTTYMTYKALR